MTLAPSPASGGGAESQCTRGEGRLSALGARGAGVVPLSPRRGRLLIGVDDLAAGGKPDAVALLDVGERALEIFYAQRLAGDHRMQRDAQHLRLSARSCSNWSIT